MKGREVILGNDLMHVHNNMNAFNRSKNRQCKLWFNYGNNLNNSSNDRMSTKGKGDFFFLNDYTNKKINPSFCSHSQQQLDL